MDWVDTAIKLGILPAILGAIFYAIWASIKWFGHHVALPVVAKHFEHVDKSLEVMSQISELQRNCVEIQGEVLNELKSMRGKT